MNYDSVFSKDAAYFTKKGSYQVGIFSRNPYKRTGSICCHRGENTEEIFIKDNEGGDRLLQAKKTVVNGVEVLMLSVFDVEGNLVVRPLRFPVSQDQQISVSPSKTLIVVLSGSSVGVYDADFRQVKEHTISKELKNSEVIAISNNGRAVLIKDSESFIYVDLQLGKEVNVESCSVPKGYKFKVSAFESQSSNSFFVVSQVGDSCLIKEGGAEMFSAYFTGKLLAVYAARDVLYVLTSETITAYESKYFRKNGFFDLISYYEGQFGKSSMVRPFFSQNEFFYQRGTFFIRGGGGSGVFFEINQVND